MARISWWGRLHRNMTTAIDILGMEPRGTD
jgi:hypothetical protein